MVDLKEQKERRKNYFINRDLQGSYIRFTLKSTSVFLTLLVVFFGIVAGVNYAFFDRLGMTSEMESVFWSTLGMNTVMLAGIFILFTLASYIIAILVSHRVAGPAFSYERRLRSLSLGDFKTPFTSRKTDQLKDLEDSLNQYRLMAWQKFEDLENRRESYIKKLNDIQDDAKKFRLQHLLKTPLVESLEKHTSRRMTGMA
jgi:ABC-type transport system involved in multi-copper enzyme maturation permease subunit